MMEDGREMEEKEMKEKKKRGRKGRVSSLTVEAFSGWALFGRFFSLGSAIC